MKILHSCNGLLLCGDTWLSNWNVVLSLYLYNPTLGWHIQIPSSEGMRRDLLYDILNEHYWNLAFDPLESSSYKIIDFSRPKFESSCYRYSIEIYSSETGLWKLVNNDILSGDDLKLSINFYRGVLLNGIIYWPSFGRRTTLCFDVAKESIKSIPMPPNGIWPYCNSFFVESGGHLYHVVHQESQCFVHEMEDSCSGWLLKYSVDMDAVLGACPSMVRERAGSDKCPYLVLSFIPRVDQKDELVFYIAGCAMYYDINQVSCRKICDLNDSCFDCYITRRYIGIDVHKHIEGLITLPGCRV
ncbi:F-box protein At5g07610-like [Coffea eugenioides]|uniref:F-box protein At5g07610-like n=1 Tax=Coffea eugenioides TaxID=49369 RepID=UPI000F614C72|nr:F-box protein At5g07610-like [Coffea eugenioides]XP_027170027.1 F-box protein At5g07610-like [Coffea eugenioides]